MDRQLTIGMALECVDDMKGQLFPVEMLQNARQEVSRAALKGADLRARKREASRIAGRLVKDPQTLLAQQGSAGALDGLREASELTVAELGPSIDRRRFRHRME
jgi:hypothetical protein